MSRLHPVFPVVKLMPAPVDPIPGRRSDPPPDPVLVDGEEHYEVEAILDSHIFRQRLQYLIQWKGYSYEHNSWENATDVHSPLLVDKFYATHPGAPRQIRQAHFDYIAFQSSADIASGHHSLEGG
jgi:Chromo (CHRromatin Organisation MOdifier) domain